VLRVVIAPDKFKWSLSASDAARAMARGVLAAAPDATVCLSPMADGGEGTVEALVASTSGSLATATVSGPLDEPREAEYGLLGDGSTAVLEMATASGLKLVPPDQRDPLRASTRGTGELFKSALDRGIRQFIVGIGGSATNDGGAGFAQALGYRLLDREGRELPPGGGVLDRLERIEGSGRDPRLDQAQIRVACDVDNPLCGPRGASAVYGPQKGADSKMVARLDGNLAHFARIVQRDLGIDILEIPGAGAAGGLGGGLIAFAHGRLEPGIELVIESVGLRDRLASADLCLTGEGAIDASSGAGKTAVGVARLARSLGVPAVAFAGTLGPGAEAVLQEGIVAFFSICPGPIALEEAIARASELLERTVAHAVRTFLAGRRP
jgi:glycerate kinase